MSNLKRYLQDCITLNDLIEALESLRDYEGINGDTKVVISYDYRDHWNTQVGEPVSDPLLMLASYSGYHNKLKLEETSDEEPVGDQILVIALGKNS